MTVGVAAWAQVNPERNPPGPAMARGPTTREPVAGLPPITPTTPDVKAVQELLGHAVEEATTPGKAADLLSLLARHDRDRVGVAGDWSDVDRAAEAFRAAWQARFGLGFKVSDKVPIVMSEPGVHVVGGDAGSPPTTQPGEPVRNAITVLVTGPARHRSVQLHLVNEGKAPPVWRFDLPDDVAAGPFHDALLKRLTGITADQQRWPTDVDQAYVLVTQRVLSAFGTAP